MAGSNQFAVWMDPTGKSDFDAGLLFLGAVARMYPGLTWDDLQFPNQNMAGWLTNLKHAVGDVKDGIGDVLKDTFTTVGGGAGDAVRLASDPQVASTITRAATAYETGGASEGANSILDSLKSIFTPSGQDAVTKAGAAYKQNVSSGFNWGSPWVIGGGVAAAALVVVLVARR